MSLNKPWQRGLSFIVAGLFALNTVAWSLPASLEIKHSPLADQLHLPESLARIDERYSPPQTLEQIDFPTLVHIQDPHASYEGQTKIKEILKHLKENYKFSLVLLEGGAGPLNPDLMNFFSDPSLNYEVADSLAKESELGGPELFLMDPSVSVKGYGVEEEGLYWKNLLDFRQVIRKKEISDAFLKEVKESLNFLGSHYFNPRLREFLKGWMLYQDSKAELLRHLNALEKFSKEELNLDLADVLNQREWPQLVRFSKLREIEKQIDAKEVDREKEKLTLWLQSKKMDKEFIQGIETFESEKEPRKFLEKFYEKAEPAGFRFKDYPGFSLFLAFAALRREIEAKELFDEIERLTRQTLQRLVQTEEEKKLVSLLGDYLLLKKLFSLELVREEFDKIQKEKNRFLPSQYVQRILSIPSSVIASERSERSNLELRLLRPFGARNDASSDLDTLFRKALSFYEGTGARDEALIQNTLQRMRKEKETRAVLVTGGFHSQDLLSRLKSRGIAYVEVSPRISGVGETANYLKALMAESAIKSTLYLSPDQTPLEGALAETRAATRRYQQRKIKFLLATTSSRAEVRVGDFNSLKKWWQDQPKTKRQGTLDKRLSKALEELRKEAPRPESIRMRLYPGPVEDQRIAFFIEKKEGGENHVLFAVTATLAEIIPYSREASSPEGVDWDWLETHLSSSQIDQLLQGPKPLERIQSLQAVFQRLQAWLSVKPEEKKLFHKLLDTSFRIGKEPKGIFQAFERILLYLQSDDFKLDPSSLTSGQKSRLLTAIGQLSKNHQGFLEFLKIIRDRFNLEPPQVSPSTKVRVLTAAYATLLRGRKKGLKGFQDVVTAIESRFNLDFKKEDLPTKRRGMTMAYEVILHDGFKVEEGKTLLERVIDTIESRFNLDFKKENLPTKRRGMTVAYWITGKGKMGLEDFERETKKTISSFKESVWQALEVNERLKLLWWTFKRWHRKTPIPRAEVRRSEDQIRKESQRPTLDSRRETRLVRSGSAIRRTSSTEPSRSSTLVRRSLTSTISSRKGRSDTSPSETTLNSLRRSSTNAATSRAVNLSSTPGTVSHREAVVHIKNSEEIYAEIERIFSAHRPGLRFPLPAVVAISREVMFGILPGAVMAATPPPLIGAVYIRAGLRLAPKPLMSEALKAGLKMPVNSSLQNTFGVSFIPSSPEGAEELYDSLLLVNSEYRHKLGVIVVESEMTPEETARLNRKDPTGRLRVVAAGKNGYSKILLHFFQGNWGRKLDPETSAAFKGIFQSALGLAKKSGIREVQKVQDLLQYASVVGGEELLEGYDQRSLLKWRLVDKLAQNANRLLALGLLSIHTAGLDPSTNPEFLKAPLIQENLQIQGQKNFLASLRENAPILGELDALRLAAKAIVTSA